MNDKIISTRISDVFWEGMEIYSKKTKTSKSEIAREAIKKFLKFYLHPMPRVIWGKSEYAFTLSCLNEVELQKLAEISFQNSLSVKDNSLRDLFNIEDPKSFQLNLKVIIDFLVNDAFASKGYNWFNHIKAIWKKNWVMIFGTHDIGLNFSIYIKYYFVKWMESYSFKLIKEELENNELALEFEKKKY